MSEENLTPTRLDDQIIVRVDKTTKEAFAAKCEGYGRKPSDILREVMGAIVNDGFKILIEPKDGNLYE